MTTLYRKYRPQSFSDLAGQEFIVQTIMNEVAMGNIAHAYLFSGPRGVGKTTMARLLAKAINCEKRKEGTSEPCNECTSCTEIINGRHIDVMEIDAASQTGVDNVRENIIENAQFKPTKAKHKVFIIDEVHMLSTSAFNALLKTLEEPPAHVVFILATTELHKLPATVISRCQRFNFKRIPYEQMLKQLKDICEQEKVKVDEEVLSRVILKSDGGLRDAESILGQILSLNLKKVTAEDVEMILPTSDASRTIEFITYIQEKNSSQALELIQKVAQSGASLDQFMLDCLDTLRTIMLLQVMESGSETHTMYSSEQVQALKQLAQLFSSDELINLIDAFLRRRLEIRTSPLPQLPLEILVVEHCSTTAGHRPASPTFSAPATKLAASAPKEAPKTAPTEPEAKIEALTEAAPSEKPATISSTIKNAFNSLAHGTTINTTLDQIKTKWHEIVMEIDKNHHSLTFILKMCQLKEVDHGGLLLGVPYSLHKEKIEEPKCRRAIEEVLEKTFNERIPVFCTIEAIEQPPVEDTGIADLAAEFGGEVVG